MDQNFEGLAHTQGLDEQQALSEVVRCHAFPNKGLPAFKNSIVSFVGSKKIIPVYMHLRFKPLTFEVWFITIRSITILHHELLLVVVAIVLEQTAVAA